MPKARGRGSQQPRQSSDYEAQPQQPQPQPVRSIEELNRSVLQRHYPGVVSILHTTSYTTLYSFDPAENQWEKVGIEGALFVCQLIPSHTGAERFSVIILNRRSLENFDWEISSAEDMEITEDFIIVRGEEKVYGIWIFEEPEGSTANARAETANKIHELAVRATESRDSKEQALQDGVVQAADQVENGVPMGRQISLRQLFGQQREQDAGWSVHDHHSQGNTPQQQPFPAAQPPPNDHLGQLFSKARQNYNGVG
jgi:hypothetical protein